MWLSKVWVFKRAVGVDRYGHLLVQQWQAEQGTSLQGVQDPDEGDRRALDSSREGIRKEETDG